jgi:DNA gyrase/topoisomerase IV subunit B
MAVIKKKNKGQEVKAGQIKNHLAIFVNALVENPAFDSQTKETLTTKSSAFGSTCLLPDRFLKLIENSSIVDDALKQAKFKQDNDLKKKSGAKKSTLMNIAKLDDANYAGTVKSKNCTLILTEGDSAKALAISGLGNPNPYPNPNPNPLNFYITLILTIILTLIVTLTLTLALSQLILALSLTLTLTLTLILILTLTLNLTLTLTLAITLTLTLLLGVVGRDYYGVFPLKGKLLNVREAQHAQIMKSEEIQNIVKILG